jgi:acetyl-CoA acetyltransferase
MGAREFRDKYAIVGAALTPTARTHAPGVSGLMLEAWAARLAMEDAGLTRQDIDGAVHGMMASPHTPTQWTDSYSRTLGLKPNIYINVARGGQAAHNGILLATQLLSLDLATYVIVSCGLPGWSASHGPSRNQPRDKPIDFAVSQVGVGMAGQLDHGLAFLGFGAAASGAAVHGFYMSRHQHEYGTKAEEIGAIAVSTRAWANLNPEARFYDRPLTLEDYMNSPFIVEPVRRADCCVQSDLGAALIVTTSERASSLRQKPAYIKGIGIGDQAREQWWNKTNYTQVDAAFAGRQALHAAGVRIEDVDVAEMYDCFTTEVIFYLEDYGWCQKGEGGALAASGATEPGGSIPVNTHGGLLSGMYLFDFPNVVEAVRQLRGEGGERQVKDAQIALTNGHGGEMISNYMCAAHATMITGNELS